MLRLAEPLTHTIDSCVATRSARSPIYDAPRRQDTRIGPPRDTDVAGSTHGIETSMGSRPPESLPSVAHTWLQPEPDDPFSTLAIPHPTSYSVSASP